MPAIEEIVVADEPDRWRALGLDVHDGVCRLGGVDLRLAGVAAGGGVIDWALSGLVSSELDGLATRSVAGREQRAHAAHPNGVTAVDHVVAVSPDLDRTVGRLESAGLDLRRIREEPTPAGAPRQAFFRLRGVILEVIQQPFERPGFDRSRPAHLWGLALVCTDFEALSGFAAGAIKGPRPAVQPGRQIATVSRAAGLTVPVAFMSGRPAVPTA